MNLTSTFPEVGTNDVTNRRSNAGEIASGIMQVVSALFKNKGDATIILPGIFPGQRNPVSWCGELFAGKILHEVNTSLLPETCF